MMNNIGCIILAAGESKRMGCPKMLLHFGSSTVIETLIDSVSKSDVKYLTVVIGAHRGELKKLLVRREVNYCINENYERGMLSSVLCGLNSLPSDIDAFMVIPGDQPLINSTIINHLIEKYYLSGKGIAVPVFEGKKGHPIIIDKRYLKSVMDLSPEEGLRGLLTSNQNDLELVEINSGAILKDIDTRNDYDEILKNI